MRSERFDIVVIGGGQAGLAAGYYLARQKRDFVILDSHERVGDSWRKRWDSLRLFTPVSLDHLPGMKLPKSTNRFPTKDEMADYLEAYAARFEFPVELGVRVDELTREDHRYSIRAGARRLEADHVIVATGAYPTPRVPKFAGELDPAITQLLSVEYRRPNQLRDGPVLVVGAGNSGAEIARDLSATHPTWLAGPDTGFIPGTYGSLGYCAAYVVIFTLMKLFTVDTSGGRSVIQKARAFTGGHPLVRVKPRDLLEAGVERVPRVAGVRGGQPILEDGRVLDVANVVWATGFVRDYRWIRLPIFDGKGDPIHHRGVVRTEPGLYFTGLPFQSSLLSGHVAAAGNDAKYIVKQITARETDLARGQKADKLSRQASSTN
jgi:putative flavoprotein involved in K+ transport